MRKQRRGEGVTREHITPSRGHRTGKTATVLPRSYRAIAARESTILSAALPHLAAFLPHEVECARQVSQLRVEAVCNLPKLTHRIRLSIHHLDPRSEAACQVAICHPAHCLLHELILALLVSLGSKVGELLQQRTARVGRAASRPTRVGRAASITARVCGSEVVQEHTARGGQGSTAYSSALGRYWGAHTEQSMWHLPNICSAQHRTPARG